MKAQVTDWYPPQVKPVRLGWYERSWDEEKNFPCDYWNGSWWEIGDIQGNRCGRSLTPLNWRGLASDPNA